MGETRRDGCRGWFASLEVGWECRAWDSPLDDEPTGSRNRDLQVRDLRYLSVLLEDAPWIGTVDDRWGGMERKMCE